MNWMPSNMGAEPKKVAILVVIAAVGAGVYLYNRHPSKGPASAPPIISRAPVTTSYRATARPERSSFRVVQNAVSGTREFRPSLKIKDIESTNIDPTMHLDLLAKLKTVDVVPSSRSPFEFGAEPRAEISLQEPDKIAIVKPFVGPQPVEPPVEPKAPPIPLKFYGFVNKSKVGDKRAFFLDEDDIVIAAEGDMIKKRYKIVRIGVKSAVLEDTQFKSDNQQTLPLEAEKAG
jgi:hypothetical protein